MIKVSFNCTIIFQHCSLRLEEVRSGSFRLQTCEEKICKRLYAAGQGREAAYDLFALGVVLFVDHPNTEDGTVLFE